MIYTLMKKRRNPKPDKIDLYSNPSLEAFIPVSRKWDKEDMCKFRSKFLETFEGECYYSRLTFLCKWYIKL